MRLWRRSPSRAYAKAAQRHMDALADGFRNPEPLAADELANLLTHASGAARRSFPALYDDEEGRP